MKKSSSHLLYTVGVAMLGLAALLFIVNVLSPKGEPPCVDCPQQGQEQKQNMLIEAALLAVGGTLFTVGLINQKRASVQKTEAKGKFDNLPNS